MFIKNMMQPALIFMIWLVFFKLSQCTSTQEKGQFIEEKGENLSEQKSHVTREQKHRFCGVQDNPKLLKRNRRERRFILRGIQWRKKYITWRLLNYSPYLNAADTIKIIDTAFKTWAKPTSLVFQRIKYGKADIMIQFADEFHKLSDYTYCSMRFDGPGGNMAHAFYPFANLGYGGDIHIDYREEFSLGGKKGLNFAAVILHEIGHSLGLMHTNNYISVMNPDFILEAKGNHIQLEYDDVLAIQSLYGYPHIYNEVVHNTDYGSNLKENRISTTEKGTTYGNRKVSGRTTLMKRNNLQRQNLNTPVTPNPQKGKPIATTAANPQTQSKNKSSCPTAFESIFLSQMNSKTYVVQDGIVFPLGKRLENTGVRMPVEKWFHFKSIDASYVRRKSKELVVFSGTKFAVLKNEISLKRVGSIYDLGFPLYIKKIDAAVIFGQSKNTYYFAGKLYWRFNEKRQKMDKGYPKKISPIWKGLPPNLDSALTWRNGVTYFFKGPLYYRINYRTASVESGYPKLISSIWTRC